MNCVCKMCEFILCCELFSTTSIYTMVKTLEIISLNVFKPQHKTLVLEKI